MIFNFSAGPAVIYEDVLQELNEEILDYKGMGYSILEASHRGAQYNEIHEDSQQLIRDLLDLGKDFEVLFLGGGATLQFSMLPLNYLSNEDYAQYVLSGSWAQAAIENAKKIGKVELAFDGTGLKFVRMPTSDELNIDSKSSYLHITSNETIGGIQWKQLPDTGTTPLVADMSSDIMSRSFDAKKFSLIYASTQKNLGIAGLTVVVVRNDFLERARSNKYIPDYLSYKIQAKANSLLNTPPVCSVWVLQKVLRKIFELGGLSQVESINRSKAQILYDCIDTSDNFYHSPVETESRSDMNVVFRLGTQELEQRFIAEAEHKGFVGLKGHRSVGGCRASIYNGMKEEGVRQLVEFMNEFKNLKG